MTKVPTDHELVDFFETEPRILDASIPWFYNTLTFETKRGADQVTAILSPASGILQLQWTREQHEIVSLDVNNISEIAIEKEYGAETLEARFPDKSSIQPLRLQLKPYVKLTWGS